MRRVSLNFRQVIDAPASDEIEVGLFVFEHPLLDAPIRLSTDNTERLSDDPLIYGTRSAWLGADPVSDPYLWAIAEAVLPGDGEAAPAAATIILHNLDSQIVETLRSFTDPPTVHMAIVLASSPDLIEEQYLDLRLTGFEASAGEVSLTISREEVELEHFPAGRMTRNRFPGLHA